mmetsp:Transcript_18162/g.29386  ORF Transcript_18162/g.29386 Transcript_18162/m.29386 type:complete len:104 (-) Transcript_18162:164-475(-)
MAVVTRSDCTQVQVDEETTFTWNVAESTLEAGIYVEDIDFNACQGLNNNNNNLEARAKLLHANGLLAAEKLAALQGNLVGSETGKCNAAIEQFLGTKGITRIS